MEIVINIPNQASLHALKSLFCANIFFPDSPKKFRLIFNSRFIHFEPFMIAMLAAWADYWQMKGVEIVCENTETKGVNYAARMGLFNFLQCENLRNSQEHESAGEFVPLYKLERSRDVADFMGELMPILKKHHSKYADAVKYSLSELTRNVMEHAGGAPAFACAQFYKKSDKVSIGVADCGIGIKESLLRSHVIDASTLGVVEAVKPGVSGAVKSMYGGSDNAGAGLFYNKCIAHASKQYFAIASGEDAFRLRRKQNSASFNADPDLDRHDIYTIPKWIGTVVGLDISITSGQEFAALTKKILDTYTKQFKPKGKVNINFS